MRFVTPIDDTEITLGVSGLLANLAEYGGEPLQIAHRVFWSADYLGRMLRQAARHRTEQILLPIPMSVVFSAMMWCSRPTVANMRPSSWPKLQSMSSTGATPKLARDWSMILSNYCGALDMLVQTKAYHRIITGRSYGDASMALHWELNKWAGYERPVTA